MESLDDYFARFESIVSRLRSRGPLAYSNNEHDKQLLYALDDLVWYMKITTLEESTNFATIDTEKLFSKLKSHELSRKGHPNYDTSLTSTTFVTSTRVGEHMANPTNTTDSSALKFALFSLAAASDEQYESISTTRLPYWRESFTPYTSFVRRGGDHRGATSSVATPPTSSPTAPSERSSTPPPTSTTTIIERLKRQGRGQEEVSLQGQEKEVPEDDVPSVCCPQRP
jgi:hypothetical protein